MAKTRANIARDNAAKTQLPTTRKSGAQRVREHRERRKAAQTLLNGWAAASAQSKASKTVSSVGTAAARKNTPTVGNCVGNAAARKRPQKPSNETYIAPKIPKTTAQRMREYRAKKRAERVESSKIKYVDFTSSSSASNNTTTDIVSKIESFSAPTRLVDDTISDKLVSLSDIPAASALITIEEPKKQKQKWTIADKKAELEEPIKIEFVDFVSSANNDTTTDTESEVESFSIQTCPIGKAIMDKTLKPNTNSPQLKREENPELEELMNMEFVDFTSSPSTSNDTTTYIISTVETFSAPTRLIDDAISNNSVSFSDIPAHIPASSARAFIDKSLIKSRAEAQRLRMREYRAKKKAELAKPIKIKLVPSTSKDTTADIVGKVESFLAQTRPADDTVSDNLLPMTDTDAASAPKVIEKTLIETVNRACIKMVTQYGLPLSSMDSEAFRKDSGLNGSPVAISSRVVANKVKEVATKIRASIANELRGRMFSLKLDAAYKKCRGIFCVNAQFVVDAKIQVRSLGLIKMQQNNSAEYIRCEVVILLAEYNCYMGQVCACIIDNGLSIVIPDQNSTAAKCSVQNADIEVVETILEKMDGSKLTDSVRFTRCASHKIHLAVNDVLQHYNDNIEMLRSVFTKIRQELLQLKMRIRVLSIPPLDACTAWPSFFIMCKYMREHSNVFHTYLTKNIARPELWRFIETIVASFECVYQSSTRLEEPLTIGDFVCLWIELKMELSQINLELAVEMMSSMDFRMYEFLSNDFAQAAMYMDSRFNFTASSSLYLSNEAKLEAEVHSPRFPFLTVN